MTEITKPRVVSMTSAGHTHHVQLSDGSSISTRIEWTVEDAIEGLVNEWLDTADAVTTPRVIRDETGKRLGVLVTAEEYDEGRNAIHRINEDSYGHADSAYVPFRHHPTGNMERLINTDALERVMRNLVYGQDAEITKAEADRIHYLALVAAIEFSFEPDSRGLVPVMTPGRATDGQHTEFYWSYLYPTPVAGLFLRPDDAIVGGIEYTLTTGSGYAVVRGFWDQDYANALAVKLGEALPGINWFTARNGNDLTTEIKQTMAGIIREHGFWPKEEA